MDEAWIPLMGMVCVFGLPIGGWITVRVLQHRERMAMLQRGIVPPPQGLFRRGVTYSQPPPQGQSWTVPPSYGPAAPYGCEDPNSPQALLRKGITTAAVGIALFIGLSFIGYRGGDGLLNPPTWHPGAWLLGGLIPMFVGIAQIAIAILSGAQFIGLRQPPPSVSPPPSGGPFTGYGTPTPSGSTASRFEELARPVPPPDRTEGR